MNRSARVLRQVVRSPLALLFFACGITTAAAAPSDSLQTRGRQLADLSIEQLMNVSITSVAKKEQRLADAPAAVYILTAEEILRAGHGSIPEALRMVPGLSVAQLGSHDWVITSRGFGAEYAGKLLVLIDGRSVYNPFFSGVFWSIQDLLVEDLDRIEIIRGPGAALWGANAVNGVINIITKQASETQGLLGTAGGGTQESAAALRYGGQVGSSRYRAYAKYNDFDDFAHFDGSSAQDSWHIWRAGFRADSQVSDASQLTLQGDAYGGKLGVVAPFTSLTPPYMQTRAGARDASGANLLLRWQRGTKEGSRWMVQTYYDRTEMRDPRLGITRDTFDIEFQHQLPMSSRHVLVYGAGYRNTEANYEDAFFLSYPYDHDHGDLINVFAQDEITLVPETLRLTLGSKFEHNEFTSCEVQPSARILWTPNPRHSIWAGVSRAVRTPNFLENALRINYAAFDPDGPGAQLPRVLSTLPNHDLESEAVVAYELGYRSQIQQNLYLDVATFFNRYHDLIAEGDTVVAFEATPPPAHVAITRQVDNTMHGRTYGIELAPSWQVTERWKLAAGYTWLHMDLHSSTVDGYGEEQEGDSPRHQWHVRSFTSWPYRLAFDTSLYYVGGLPNQEIASYLRLDARLGWKATERLDLSLTGTNLLDGRHPEFRSYMPSPVEARRSVQAKVTWRFD